MTTSLAVTGAVSIYTDGASKGNPGPMGLGVVALDEDKNILLELGQNAGKGTNQQAEILAAALGLEMLAPGIVTVFTDSKYVVSTMEDGWKRKVNLQNWDRLDRAVRRHKKVRFEHVRGHNGNLHNEMADALASEAAFGRETRVIAKMPMQAPSNIPFDQIADDAEYIAAAAVKRDGLTYSLPRPYRHSHLVLAFQKISGTPLAESEQGFMTSTGRFVARKVAARLALAAGQISTEVGELQAENLW